MTKNTWKDKHTLSLAFLIVASVPKLLLIFSEVISFPDYIDFLAQFLYPTPLMIYLNLSMASSH